MSRTDWTRVTPIREIETPSRQTFHEEVVPAHEPVVMRGLVRDWPAVSQASPTDLLSYLGGFAGTARARTFIARPDRNRRFVYTADGSEFDFAIQEWAVPQLLNELQQLLDAEAPNAVYAGGVPVDAGFPGLMAGHPMPLLDGIDDHLVNIWLGNRTRTAAHWDLATNIACVVAGRRRFALFPTDQVHNLYVGSLTKTPAGQAISLVDVNEPDFERHPRFREALEHARVTVLEPGDALFIPSLWFHDVESLDPLGMMINYWWRDAPAHLITPLITLFHSLLTLKGLPQAELDAWRVLFDHYVFRANGEPLEHLPEPARGMMGQMSPEMIRRLKDQIRNTLR